MNIIFAHTGVPQGVPDFFKAVGSYSAGAVLFDAIIRANSLHHRKARIKLNKFSNAMMGTFFAMMVRHMDR